MNADLGLRLAVTVFEFCGLKLEAITSLDGDELLLLVMNLERRAIGAVDGRFAFHFNCFATAMALSVSISQQAFLLLYVLRVVRCAALAFQRWMNVPSRMLRNCGFVLNSWLATSCPFSTLFGVVCMVKWRLHGLRVGLSAFCGVLEDHIIIFSSWLFSSSVYNIPPFILVLII